MVTLTEALAAEHSKRRRDTEDASKRKQVGRALLQALVQCLNAEPLPAWSFALDDTRVHILRTNNGSQRRVGTWTIDQELRMVLGEETTEWITVESCNRVIDGAVQITARFIIDAFDGPMLGAVDVTFVRIAALFHTIAEKLWLVGVRGTLASK